MPVICFFNSVRFWGGGEKLHLELALGCKQAGYSVIVACDKDGALWQRATQAGLTCVHVRIGNLSFLNPFAQRKLVNQINDIAPDAVIITTSQDVKAAGFAAKKANVHKIVYLRGLAAAVKNSFVNRTLFTRTLTHIIANSNATKQKMLEHMHDVHGLLPVQVVYHGIHLNTPISTKRNTFIAQHAKGIILGNAGRLTAQKGQMDLIHVAHALKNANIDFSLFIAGEGEDRKQLENAIVERGLQQHVFIMGFVEDMESFMQSIDIFLLSSYWEGFGFVLAEAMAHSLPIVAYDISSNTELIVHDYTGILVPPGDIVTFTNAVQLLAENDDLRIKMGANGLQRVQTNFEFNAQLKQLLQQIGFE